jgi:AraC family transcriptional regulator
MGAGNLPQFAWYDALPNGFQLIRSRCDASRRSVSWYLHRIPPTTEWQLDFSPDPVVSLETGPLGTVERRLGAARDHAELLDDTVTFTPARAPCEWRWSGKAFEVLDVHIPNELLSAAWGEFGKGDPASINLQPRLRVISPTLLLVLKSLCCTISAEAQAHQLLYQAFTCHLIACLFLQDSDLFRAERPHRGLPLAALRRVLEYINEHLDQDLSLDRLAEVSGRSSYHFLRQFKVSTGVTPHRYVINQRLDLARKLLAQRDLTVLDIALRCGFGDSSHFAECFRKRYALAPTMFREAYR